MQTRAFISRCVLVVSCAFGAVHCGGVVETHEATSNPPPSATTAPTTTPTTPPTAPTSAPTTPPTTTPPPTTPGGSLRLAHLSSAIPSFDYCISSGGGAFRGPILGGSVSTTAPIDRLSYRSVSRYLPLDAPAGNVLRFVRPGGSCEAKFDGPLAGDRPIPGAIAAGGRYTLGLLAIVADGTFEPLLRVWRDETADDVPAGEMKMRVANASSGSVNLFLDTGSGKGLEELASDVTSGEVSRHSAVGPVSDNGYVSVHGAIIASARLADHADPKHTIDLPGGLFTLQLQSLFVVGSWWDPADGLDVLVCYDDFSETEPVRRCQSLAHPGE